MPIELGVWKLGKKLEKVSFGQIGSEEKLEDTLVSDISVLSSDLMIIGRQVPTAHGKYIDLLAMDSEGNLSVIELKKHKTPREAVAQLLDYASWVQTLAYEEIADIYGLNNNGKEFEIGFAEVFGSNPPEEINKEHHLVLVAGELDNASERIINYLAEKYGVPINAVFFRYFQDGASEYLARTWLIDPQEAEAISNKAAGGKGREGWNGQDFYVNFGPTDTRDWEDARKYGFVSGGGAKWFSQTLNQLFHGARVFVNVPSHGYVGVGKVLGTMVPMTQFSVELDGKEVPITKVQLKSAKMGKGDQTDPDKAEYMVRMQWLKTVPLEQAYWEKGMYSNQNTVTKLRNKFTLERLVKHFGLEE